MAKAFRDVYRPADLKLRHLEHLNLHVRLDVSPSEIVPADPVTGESYLPPAAEWNGVPPAKLSSLNEKTKKPLSNGNLSPGVQTYIESQNELSVDNPSAFRTIRRMPALPGTTPARLGNAYEFFKNLEVLAGYWDDTSLPHPPTVNAEMSPDAGPLIASQAGNERTSAGSSTPNEFRQNLITAFVKMVAYDFGCNVSQPRVEPRLYIPGSYFQSNLTFVYRTPTNRSEARSGIVEGPLAVVSARPSTSFTPQEGILDLGREVVAALLTAQQRARFNKTEVRIGEGQWWCTAKRWGGGSGGPIGKEQALPANNPIPSPEESLLMDIDSEPRDRKKSRDPNKKTLSMYDSYRMIRPPASNWDRRAKYQPIGKQRGKNFDDVFLFSSLFHHISIVRVRTPSSLLAQLDGRDAPRERLEMWRSKWYDLFIAEERIEAMQCVWGVIAYLMRKVD